jgi:peptidoglycan hydrolase-like protein with peptidoglycan-binding domain
VRRGRIALGCAALAAAAGAAYLVLGRSADDTTAAADTTPVTTAKVVRRDLAETDSFDGTLGYASSRPVVNQLQGTFTALAPEGSVVSRGQALYRVDGTPVTLMYGTVPAYRPLSQGVDNGPDVKQLEWNLVALGYDPNRDISIDQKFGWATTAAVKRWQEDLGLTEDGVVQLGQVVFLPGKQRIGEHQTSLGLPAQPGSEVMTTASTTQVVTVDLEASRQELVHEGDRVSVQLPGGNDVNGTISSVGKIAESSDDSNAADTGDPGGATAEPTIAVTIALAGRASTDLDQAPVTVEITRNLERNVLAVPVTALLALAGGGYGVELSRADGTTRLVGVETGVYADGYVQVMGAGIEEGASVVVPE